MCIRDRPNTAYAQYFTGESFLNPLTDPTKTVFLANVTFSPACRNNWHIHHAKFGGGQLLLCTDGLGSVSYTHLVYALEQLSIPAGVAEKGHAYYMENRVIYLSVDGTAGRAIVSGSVPYEITFTYADGSVSALTCGCYETGLCKHGAAVLLQLRETLEKIHEHWPDALAEDGYFAAVSKSAFSFFTTSSSKPASITLT